MKTQADLEAMSTKDILAYYNTTAAQKGAKLVVRFADRGTAIKRTMTLQGEATGAGAETTPKPPAEAPKPKPEATPDKPKGEAEKGAKAPEATKGKGKGAKPEAKERKQRGMRFVFPVEKEIKPVREGSKRYKLLQLLQTDEGATFEECMKHTGWERKDCYEGIRLLHYYSGYGMSHDDKTGKIKVRTK